MGAHEAGAATDSCGPTLIYKRDVFYLLLHPNDNRHVPHTGRAMFPHLGQLSETKRTPSQMGARAGPRPEPRLPQSQEALAAEVPGDR